MFVRLTDAISVAPQIAPEDVARARDEGFATIVNNRPDGEAPGQPEGNAIRAAAEAAGLRYIAIPVGHDGIALPQVEAMVAALASPRPSSMACSTTPSRSGCNRWRPTCPRSPPPASPAATGLSRRAGTPSPAGSVAGFADRQPAEVGRDRGRRSAAER